MEVQLREFSHNLLKSTAHEFTKELIHVRAISLRGGLYLFYTDPREEIEHKIASLKPDLVIMGSRGLNAFSRVVLGSVRKN
jgi:hypothetical protein